MPLLRKQAAQNQPPHLKRHSDKSAHLCSASSEQSSSQHHLLRFQTLPHLHLQLSDLKAKQVAQAQLLRMKQRSDEKGKQLQEEIQRIKSQKVQLQRKMKLESDQFHSWKVSHEKELGQLRKAGRRNEYEMHKLQALHQRQQKVRGTALCLR